jgi:hypothetical protein
MSIRVQVILDEGEAAKFKAQAFKESKSLSAWLREAGKKKLQESQKWQTLTDPVLLKAFFKQCNEKEKGVEPDWKEQKNLILKSYKGENRA